MQSNPEDRPEFNEPSKLKNFALLLLAAALIAVVVWHAMTPSDKPLLNLKKLTSELGITLEQDPPTDTDEKDTVAETIVFKNATEQPTIELPSLDDSDTMIKQQIATLSNTAPLTAWLKPEHLVRRGVAVLYGLSQGAVVSKHLNIPAPKNKLQTNSQGDKIWLDADNYGRYDYFVTVVSSLDAGALASLYHRVHPLLEEAFGELGHPTNALDNTVLAAIDQILTAPLPEEPIELKLESVVYTFANPELEQLPPVQKLLIRMGPENSQKIQSKFSELRNQLVQ